MPTCRRPRRAYRLPVGPVAGLLLGLGLGVGVAFVRDRSDATVRDPLSELPEMGSPILGFGPGTNHIAVTEGSAPDVDEAYRRTQAGLLFKMDRNDQQIVLVTGTVGAMDSDSAAIAAANLAVAAARVGRKTLLVLSDLRNPRIHQRFRLDNSKGLAEVINGKASLKEVSHQVPQLSTLFVLPPGDDLSSPTRLLAEQQHGTSARQRTQRIRPRRRRGAHPHRLRGCGRTRSIVRHGGPRRGAAPHSSFRSRLGHAGAERCRHQRVGDDRR